MTAAIAADAPGRTCSRCNVYKDRDQFDRMRQANSGMHPRCKDCRREAFKAGYARDGVKIRERQRWQHTKHRYGIDQANYEALLTAQGGVCAICRRGQTDARDARLCIDHDHRTGAEIGRASCRERV